MPSTLVAFDILERDGRALLDASFDERQKILRAVPIVPPVIFAEHQRIDSSGDALVAVLEREFTAALQRGHGGLKVKSPRPPYPPRRPCKGWLTAERPPPTVY